MDLLLSHRSVRGFLSDPLPAGTLEALVAAAQSASSSSNVQAWTVIAVENPETKAALAKIANGQKHMEECPVLLVWCADLARTKQIGERHSYPTDATGFLESFIVSVVDAALAAQNATVAAESFGLGMVYIGALRNNPEEVARILKLPPNCRRCVRHVRRHARSGAPLQRQAAAAAACRAASRALRPEPAAGGARQLRHS